MRFPKQLIRIVLALLLGGLVTYVYTTRGLQVQRSSSPGPSLPSPRFPASYRFDLEYNETVQSIGGQAQIFYRNGTNRPMSEVILRLYPNANVFKRPPSGQELSRQGLMSVHDITVNGHPVVGEGQGTTVLRIPLLEPLEPEGEVRIVLSFTTFIPSCCAPSSRFFADATGVTLGNWFPILSVATDNGWNTDPYVPIGDPFYSESANYDITVRVPEGFVVAATGDRVSRDGSTWRFRAENVRNVGMWIALGAVPQSIQVGDLQLNYFIVRGHSSDQAYSIHTLQSAIHTFTELFGPYPYGELTVIDNGRTSTEYPQLVFASAGPDTAIHEIAHQWWYAVVGSDQSREYWDEAIATYSEYLYWERTVGKAEAEQRTRWLKVKSKSNGGLRRALSEYEGDSTDYTITAYYRGPQLFHSLRKRVGDNAFFSILREMYRRHRFGVASWDDWKRTAEDVTKNDLDSFWADWGL